MMLPLLAVWAGSVLAQGSGAASSSQSVRPIGVVTKLQAGSLTLHTDAGPDLLIVLADGASFLRVPPGATNLNTATKIAMSDISSGDRVLVRGRVSEDQKSIIATSVIVMSKSDLASAREAERLDWQRRGIGGTVDPIAFVHVEIVGDLVHGDGVRSDFLVGLLRGGERFHVGDFRIAGIKFLCLLQS